MVFINKVALVFPSFLVDLAKDLGIPAQDVEVLGHVDEFFDRGVRDSARDQPTRKAKPPTQCAMRSQSEHQKQP